MKPEQQTALREQFPPHVIGKLPRANIQLDYVGHAAVTDRLLKVDPEWSWEPLAFTDEGLPKIAVRGQTASMWIRLTVAGVTRLGVGTVPSNKADVEKELISDALRNAAMRFGVALDLWSKEELWDAPEGVNPETGEIRAGEAGPESHSGATKPSSPARQSGGPKVATEKQRGFMTKLIEKKGLPDGCPYPVPDDIPMSQASKWIDVLQDMPDETPPAKRANDAAGVKAIAEAARNDPALQPEFDGSPF